MVTKLPQNETNPMINWLVDILENHYFIAKTGLGKFIILAGCLLHLGWALLLGIEPRVAGATPLSALFYLCGSDRAITILVLCTVSALSMWYLSLKSHQKVTPTKFALLMLPQLWTLATSLLAGIYASCVGYYLDTVRVPGEFTIVNRPHLFILADQLPVMVLSILYILAVIFACTYRVPSNGQSNSRA